MEGRYKKSVLISLLNWKNYADTIQCLEQLFSFNFASEDILVVDNGSPNDSVGQIRKSFPEVRIIELKKNEGFAAGHKVSADIAINENAELLWILNPDVQIRTDSLDKLVEAYRRNGNAIYGSITLKSGNPDIIGFGGGQEIQNHPQEIPFSYNLFEDRLLHDCLHELSQRKVQSVEGSSMLVPVEVIKKYGFMSTRYFLYGEETDYCLRLWKAGIPSIVVSSSIVLHKGGASFEGRQESDVVRQYYRSRNWRLIARKHFGMKRSEIIKSSGGALAFIKFYLKWMFASTDYRSARRQKYYENLAMLHAIFNISGKRVSPEKFLK